MAKRIVILQQKITFKYGVVEVTGWRSDSTQCMSVSCNAREGNGADIHVELIARGKGKNLKDEEKKQWHKDVSPSLFQEKAWVDRKTMLQIAENFVKRKIDRHGLHAPVHLIWMLIVTR